MKKKLFATLLTSVLAVSAITGCSKDASNSEPTENTQNTEDAAKEGDGDLEVITVAATAVPHAEILESEVVTSALAAKGYKVEVTVFEDYVQPNNVVDAGEFDANYFQHITYLNDFNDQNGTSLVNAGGIHYEPFGIYGGTKKSLDEIADGDTIAIPNDTTNEARALLLLEAN